MKKFILKMLTGIATYSFLFGLLFSSWVIWSAFKERNINTVPVHMTVETVKPLVEEEVYVTITGGKLDIENTFEVGLSYKNTDAMYTTHYYAAVVDSGNNKLKYVVMLSEEPVIKDFISEVEFSGLLKNKTDLSSEVTEAIAESYPGQSYTYLETSYRPVSFFQKINRPLAIYYLTGFGFILLIILSFFKEKKAEPVIPVQE